MNSETNPEIRPTRQQLVEALAALVVEALRRTRLNASGTNKSGKQERGQPPQKGKSAPKH